MSRTNKVFRKAAGIGAALCVALLLSGCVIEPIGPYYHPHHYWGY